MPLADGLALRPITRQHATSLRSEGGIAYVADATPRYLCRQCLRHADIGDEMMRNATMVDGSELAESVNALFEPTDAVAVQVYNLPCGCSATPIERSSPSRGG